MIFFEPEERTADEEVANLIAPKVEYFGAPVLMLALAGVRVFKEVGAIEKGQAMRITGEVGRNPVENDADIMLVALVDKIFEIIRAAKAAGGGKVACRLIAP